MTNERRGAPPDNGGSRRLELRREREARWPPLFHGAFRPFFLASALWFPLALLWWVASLSGYVAMTSALGPLAWHRHELLFGGAGAAVAGYALTATPNWSGGLPSSGGRLLAMLIWWGLARIANASPPLFGPIVPAFLDVGFFVALAVACGREARYGKRRNSALTTVLPLLALACTASHVAAAAVDAPPRAMTHAAVALIVMLISATASRLVPSFTRNVLPPQKGGAVTAQQGRFDVAVQTVTGAAMLLWLIDFTIGWRTALVAAALVQAIRLVRWRGWQVRSDPSVFALHVAYAWLPIGLAALALAGPVQHPAALHAITAGAVPAMILAVMARVSITQTGQRPRLHSAPLVAVVLVSLGAAIRVGSGLLDVPDSVGRVAAASGLALGFCTFLIVFAGPAFQRRASVPSMKTSPN